MIITDMATIDWLYRLQHATPPDLDAWVRAVLAYCDRFYEINDYTINGTLAVLAYLKWKRGVKIFTWIKNMVSKGDDLERK